VSIKSCLSIIVLFLISANALANESRKAALLSVYQSVKNEKLELIQGLPLTLKSDFTKNRLSAEVYAIKSYDFLRLSSELSKPAQWCQFITLHLNIKACVYRTSPGNSLSFFAGRKFYQPAQDAFELQYQFKREYLDEHYFKLSLTADSGPFATKDYQINLEILKVDHDVLLHMSLAYQTSFSSRLGSSVYLSTLGADKVGFSLRRDESGEINFISGIEAIVERNVMRYFLALSVYMENTDTDKMIKAWYLSTEKYARQLHEVKEAQYIKTKQLEFKQQAQMQQRVDGGKPVFDLAVD